MADRKSDWGVPKRIYESAADDVNCIYADDRRYTLLSDEA